jgi:uncharacterized membrane protein
MMERRRPHVPGWSLSWLTARAWWEIIVPAVIAIAAIVLALAGLSTTLAGAIVGLPLVLALPGHALSGVIFPGPRLRPEERLVYSLGLSLAFTAVAGLVLNWTPIGLQARSWAVLLGATTLAGCAVAWTRRSGRQTTSPGSWSVRFAPREALLIAIAGSILVAAILVARTAAAPRPGRGFSQLWMLPPDAASAGSVRVGIVNHEVAPLDYRLAIMDGDGRLLQQWPSLRLEADHQWESTVVVPTGSSGATAMQAVLYRLDAPDTVYRRTLLRLSPDA